MIKQWKKWKIEKQQLQKQWNMMNNNEKTMKNNEKQWNIMNNNETNSEKTIQNNEQ